MKKDKMIKASYDFLCQKAREKTEFTVQELSDASGWKLNNAKTNISKRIKGFISKKGRDSFLANTKILDVSYEEYFSLFRQADLLAPDYNEYQYADVVIFELFLPLTCEDKLKRALDKLFYRDTVLGRLNDIGIQKILRAFDMQKGKTRDEIFSQVCNFVSEYFGGYSISHVYGRFRGSDLLTKKEALDAEKDGEYYLFDETTAVVRFIIPLRTTEMFVENGDNASAQIPMELDIDKELRQVEWLFRHLFIDAILNTVGQEQIWVLQTGKRCKLTKYIASSRDD